MWKRLRFITKAKLVFGGIVVLTASGVGWYLDHNIDWAARVAWGEARGEPTGGMHAVINVMANRKKDPRFPKTLSAVARQNYQFTAYNKSDPNRLKLIAVDETDPQYVRARRLAMWAQFGLLPDITDGATYFHANSIDRPPYLAEAAVSTVIGDHIFYVKNE